MIGKLKGIIDQIEKDYLIIDVGGVGYIVFASANTLRNLPSVGEVANLMIETHVREDSINLYGFKDKAERSWFRELITVKGVGSKVALAILSYLQPSQINTAIAARDRTAFTQVSGVGPKLADRLLTELKDKAPNLEESIIISSTNKVTPISDISSDAISALTNLGYNKSEAYSITTKLLSQNDNLTVGELIKLALKELGK